MPANLELVRGLYEAIVQRDDSNPLDLCAPDIELDASQLAGLGLRPLYRGHDGVREFWHDWLAVWEEADAYIDDLIESGDDVIVHAAFHGVGRRSARILDASDFVLVSTIRGGMIARVCVYAERGPRPRLQ